MPRRGLFGRLLDNIERVFRGREREPPPEEPSPPPTPIEEPPQYPGGGGSLDDEFREIWNDTVSDREIVETYNRTGDSETEQYQHHKDVLLPLFTIVDRDDQVQAWEDYLSAFVNGSQPHEWFFSEWGLSPRDFAWEAWRDAMGYGKK